MPYETVVYTTINNLKSPSAYFCLPITAQNIQVPKKVTISTESLANSSISSSETRKRNANDINIALYCSICKRSQPSK